MLVVGVEYNSLALWIPVAEKPLASSEMQCLSLCGVTSFCIPAFLAVSLIMRCIVSVEMGLPFFFEKIKGVFTFFFLRCAFISAHHAFESIIVLSLLPL